MEQSLITARWEDWLNGDEKLQEDDFHDSGNGSSPEESLTSRSHELQLQPISRSHIKIYPHVPEFDRFWNVKCNMCGKVIRVQSFALHCVKRHNFNFVQEPDRPVSSGATVVLKDRSLDNVLQYSSSIFEESLDTVLDANGNQPPVIELEKVKLVAVSPDHEAASNISSATEEQSLINDMVGIIERSPDQEVANMLLQNDHIGGHCSDSFLVADEDENRNNYYKPHPSSNVSVEENGADNNMHPPEDPFCNKDLTLRFKEEHLNMFVSSNKIDDEKPQPPTSVVNVSESCHDVTKSFFNPQSQQVCNDLGQSFNQDEEMNNQNVMMDSCSQIELTNINSDDSLPEDLKNIILKPDFDLPEMAKLLGESDLDWADEMNKNNLLEGLDLNLPPQLIDGEKPPEPTATEGLINSTEDTQPKPSTPVKTNNKSKKTRTRSQVFDPDRHCGVLITKNEEKVPCMRAVTCKRILNMQAHSLSSRKEVPGRSQPLSVLVQNLKAEKLARKEEKDRELGILPPPVTDADNHQSNEVAAVQMKSSVGSETTPTKKATKQKQPASSVDDTSRQPQQTVLNGGDTQSKLCNTSPELEQQHLEVPKDSGQFATRNSDDLPLSLTSWNSALYGAHKIKGAPGNVFNNKNSQKLRSIFSSLLDLKPSVSDTISKMPRIIAESSNKFPLTPNLSGAQKNFPNFFSQQSKIKNGVMGLTSLMSAPPVSDQVPFADCKGDALTPTKASNGRKPAKSSASNRADSMSAVVKGAINTQSNNEGDRNGVDYLQSHSVESNGNIPAYDAKSTFDPAAQHHISQPYPMPVYQNTQVLDTLDQSYLVNSQNTPTDQSKAIQGLSQPSTPNRKRKIANNQTSPIVSKKSNPSAQHCYASPLNGSMVQSPGQPALASPGEMMSPRTPNVNHQDMNWIHQPMPHQSPVSYPPTPSPNLPSSPVKYSSSYSNAAAVHHQMSIQHQRSPLPPVPQSPSSMGPRFNASPKSSLSPVKSASQCASVMPFKTINQSISINGMTGRSPSLEESPHHQYVPVENSNLINLDSPSPMPNISASPSNAIIPTTYTNNSRHGGSELLSLF